jgi:phage gp29-like protein
VSYGGPTLARVDGDPEREDRAVVMRDRHEEMMYRSVISGWTPERALLAGAAADSGNLQHLADLCEAIMTDDRVDGVLDTRTHALLGLPVSFSGGSPQATAALQGSAREPGEWYCMHPEAELVKLLSWGIVMGIGLAQRIALPRALGQPQRYRIETWSPRWLRYDQTASQGTHWSVQTDRCQELIWPGDGEWILYMPYGTHRPWSSGKWMRLAFPWLLKRFSLEDRANHSQVLGQPLWVGKAGAGGTEKQRRTYLSQLRNMGRAGRLVLPNGWDLDLKEASGESWQIYTEQVKWADQAITITLAGQLVTTEGAKGFSNGDNQAAIKNDLIRYDGETLATCLREQSLMPWADVNYDTRHDAPWPAWDVPKPDNRKENAETIKAAGDAITALDSALAAHGVRVDIGRLAEHYDIPIEPLPIKVAAPGASSGAAPLAAGGTTTPPAAPAPGGQQ